MTCTTSLHTPSSIVPTLARKSGIRTHAPSVLSVPIVTKEIGTGPRSQGGGETGGFIAGVGGGAFPRFTTGSSLLTPNPQYRRPYQFLLRTEPGGEGFETFTNSYRYHPA